MYKTSAFDSDRNLVVIRKLSYDYNISNGIKHWAFIIKADEDRFYKIYTVNPENAIRVAMDIGKNPPPDFPPPPAPGKSRRLSRVYEAYLLTKEEAEELVRRDIRQAKKGRKQVVKIMSHKTITGRGVACHKVQAQSKSKYQTFKKTID